MPLVGAPVLVPEVLHAEAVPGAGQEAGQPSQLAPVGADGVGTAGGLQLDPADVLVRRFLKTEGHLFRRGEACLALYLISATIAASCSRPWACRRVVAMPRAPSQSVRLAWAAPAPGGIRRRDPVMARTASPSELSRSRVWPSVAASRAPVE